LPPDVVGSVCREATENHNYMGEQCMSFIDQILSILNQILNFTQIFNVILDLLRLIGLPV
jgi:hypothetical protein